MKPFIVSLILCLALLAGSVVFATPILKVGDQIESAYAGLIKVQDDQTATLQDVCGPDAPNGTVYASLYGPHAGDPASATVQVFGVQGTVHPFAVTFYAGQSNSEHPFALAIAGPDGKVIHVYTGDPVAWPPLCSVFLKG